MLTEDENSLQETKTYPVIQENPMSREENEICTLQFDGAYSREGNGAG